MEKEVNPSQDKLITRQQARELLKCSLPSLNAWEKKGDLIPIRFGRRVYYRKSDLFKHPF